MADLGIIPLIFWHPNTASIILYKYGSVLGTQGGGLFPLLCSSVCILCSSYGWGFCAVVVCCETPIIVMILILKIATSERSLCSYV